jgi:hypothetical protein
LLALGFWRPAAPIATAEAVFGITMVVGNNAYEIVLGRANAKEVNAEAR